MLCRRCEEIFEKKSPKSKICPKCRIKTKPNVTFGSAKKIEAEVKQKLGWILKEPEPN